MNLLAYVDKAQGNLSGPATRRILEREYGEYGQAAYQRLAAIINSNVARLLGKLLIEQTKSRAHHCGDNCLVESKNGAIIRKHIGFGYIDAEHAEAVDQFHRQHLNPYVNFHRPCAVPKIITEAIGKRRRVYLSWATPFELLQEVPHCESLLRPGVTFAELGDFARVQSDTEAALAMQRAKRQLLVRVGKRSA